MGTPDGNGEGMPDGWADLPPEWGPVVIPDDAAELADEAAALRRELRHRARHERWRRRLGPTWSRLLPAPPTSETRPPARLPLLIIVTMLITTTATLFTAAWPGRDPQGADATPAPQVQQTPAVGRTMPALDLITPEQNPVPLHALLPAVVLLIDGCACAQQIRDAALAVPAGVTVVTVVSSGTSPAPVPALPSTAGRVQALADPAGGIRDFVHLPPAQDTATALLVDQAGTLIRLVPAVSSVQDYQAALPSLAA